MASIPMGTALRHLHRLFDEGSTAGLSDGQLLDRFLGRRDASAFEMLVSRHGPMVLGVCGGVLRDADDAEDAFQATFLILVKRAGLIRGRDAIGAWLHRVAYRVAIQANADSRKRRAEEAQAGAAKEVSVRHEPRDDEQRAVVHEEVNRLAERYRLPVVLCYLEGKTHAQAAAELRWGEATVRRRLADARDLLRWRLIRRGVAPSAVLSFTSVPRWAEAAVPAAWARAAAGTAVRAAIRKRLGAKVASAAVTALAKHVLRQTLASRLKVGATGVLAAVATAVLAAGVGAADRPQATPASDAAGIAPKAKPDTNEERTFRGRVLGPSGALVAGAKLYLWTVDDLHEPAKDPIVRAESGRDGRFAFRAKQSEFASKGTVSRFGQVIATADGFGPAWSEVFASRVPDDLTLTLSDDLPIEGRIRDSEGRPVGGARVGLLWLAVPSGGVESFLSTVRNQPELAASLPGANPSWIGRLPGQPAFVACDAQGRFRLSGLGRDRIAQLVVDGPKIAEGKALVVSRHMDSVVGPPVRRPMPDPPPQLRVYGASFDFVAPPSRPIVGVVRDQATGKPVAGVRVMSQKMLGKALSYDDAPGAVTDGSGRFELSGHPKTRSYSVAAVPEPGSPYLVAHVQVADTPGLGPIEANLELTAGIPFRVRPLDAATKRTVAAKVTYYPLHPNPNVNGYVGFGAAGMGSLSRAKANPDGSYSGVALPGPGAICVENTGDKYLPVTINPKAHFDPEKQGVATGNNYGDERFLIVEQGEQGTWFFPHDQFQAVVLINPTTTSKPIERDATLVSGLTTQATILGPDGRPLAGAEVWNADGYPVWTPPQWSTAVSLTKLQPGRPRTILFRHAERKLAGSLEAPSSRPGPLEVRLQPKATLSGRLVDANGKPRPGLRIWPTAAPFPDWIVTDPAGRFRVDDLVPGVHYSVTVMTDYGFANDSAIVNDLTLKPGEAKDLGDVRTLADRAKITK